MSTLHSAISVPLLDLKAQFLAIEGEIREAIDRVLESQHFILGPEVESLETSLAAYCECDFAVGVSSGTDALLIALMALGVGPGDEVITTPYTFFATAGSIARLGGRPIFADIDPRSFNIDPSKVEAAISPRTKAIIPVHLYGQMADMHAIMEIANRHHLHVIEDAAQAIGAEYQNQRAGSLGHFGCFSFFPSKNLGAFGDGGLVTTRNAQLADRLRLLRNHGYRPKYYNKVLGANFRLDALQAAILSVKLKYLDSWTDARQQNANYYTEAFRAKGLVERELLVTPASSSDPNISFRHIYNQYVVRVAADQRDTLRENLRKANIGTEIYYPVPMHLQECFANLGYSAGDFPDSEAAATETIALPIYPELAKDQLQHVVDTIANYFSDLP